MGTAKNGSACSRAANAAQAIDWEDLYGRIPDESLIAEFASSFVESTSKLICALEQSIAQNDLSRAETDAHALKGAAANLGAVLLAKAAWQIENAARNSSGDLAGFMKNVKNEYACLSELLSKPNWIELVK